MDAQLRVSEGAGRAPLLVRARAVLDEGGERAAQIVDGGDVARGELVEEAGGGGLIHAGDLSALRLAGQVGPSMQP
jgi:hypothetical protein